jgi:hypothetical protein
MPTYQGIEKIQIAAFAPGMFRNAIIFSADFDIGFTDKPTKFIINAVNQIGNYDIKDEDLSYLDPYDISFGPFQFKFFLESYQIQKASGKKLLQLTFVDGSTLLDRIYVALGDKHRKLDDRAFALFPVNFPVLCEAPEFYPPQLAVNGLVNRSQKAMVPVKSSLFDSNSIIKNPASLESGGMITVGWQIPTLENFHNDCSIADFKYNFTHLLYMIKSFGIDVGGDFLRKDANGNPLIDNSGDPQYADRNPFHYKSFGGQTLRQVLNSWCKLQGYSWHYSWAKNEIIGIDEHDSQGWFRFEQLKLLVDNVQSQDGDGNRIDALIEQSTESASLAGTKRKYVTTKAIKNAKPDNSTNYDYFRPIKFGPLDTHHLFAPNQRGGITGLNNRFRDDTQLRISLGLAKFTESGREIYNVAIGCHEAVGIKILAELDFGVGVAGNQALQVMVPGLMQAMEPGVAIGRVNAWINSGIPFKIYFVKYDEMLKVGWEVWEKNIADDFLGKYYLNFDRMQNFERCDTAGGRGVFRRRDETQPRSSIFTKESVTSSLTPFPFSKILTGPYGLSLGVNQNLFAFYDKFNVLTRGGVTWGTSEAEVKGLLNPADLDSSDVLTKWEPIFKDLGAGGATTGGAFTALAPFFNGGGGLVGGAPVILGNNVQLGGQVNNAVNVMNAIITAGGLRAGQKIGMYIHPDYSHPDFPWKIKNASFTRYENRKDEDVNDPNFLNAPFFDSCPMLCGGISPRQRLCEDLNRFFKPRPWPTGLERWNLGTFNNPHWGLPAFGFEMEYTTPAIPGANRPSVTETLDIIYPTWTGYLANHKINIMRRLLDPKILTIINAMSEPGAIAPGNVSTMEMIENDVSAYTAEDGASNELRITLPGLGVADPWSLGGNFFQLGNSTGWDYMQLKAFHNNYVYENEMPNQNFMGSQPKKTLSCSVAGMDFGSLRPYLKPQFGLESMSIRMSDEGVVSELRFSNKPPTRADQKLLSRSIEADLIRAGGVYPMF